MSTSPAPPLSPTLRGRVLYVDDEEEVRAVFYDVVAVDFDVTCVESGAAALDALAADAYDVLVSDMRMNPMRGSELLAIACTLHASTPRILLTGFTDHDDLADAVNRARLFAYLQKPWDADQLKLTLRRAYESRRLELDNHRLIEELRAANAELQRTAERLQRRDGEG